TGADHARLLPRLTPSPPSGAERAGVRWGIPERSPTPTSPSHGFAVGPSLSALKGGEGFPDASGLQRLSDHFEHSGQIVHHVAIPKSDYPIPVPGDIARAGCVCLF